MHFVFSKERHVSSSNSGVRDAIDNLRLRLVLSEMLLIDCFEVAGQALSLHWVHDRGTLLDSLWRVSIYKAEVLERLRVRGRKFEVCRNIPTQSATRNTKGLITSLSSTYLRLFECALLSSISCMRRSSFACLSVKFYL